MSPMPRWGGPRDANQSEICKLANTIPGCLAFDTGAVGDGFPDLVIGWRGRNLLAEVKRDDVVPSDSKLNPKQEYFHDQWPGQVAVIRSVADLYKLLEID